MTVAARLPGSVLALIYSDTDFTALGGIVLPRGANLQRAENLDDLSYFLDRESVDVVIIDSALPDDEAWKSTLNVIECNGARQPLIVASHIPDEFLWAAVLNLGGFDVLSEPFVEEEVVRVFDGALRERLRRPATLDAIAARLGPRRVQARRPQRSGRLGKRIKQRTV
jgi:DNA-binding response OmpR family regulator